MFPKLSRADETLPEDVADFIADSLKETEELPRSQIAKVTKALGREETLALLDEVERIESEGGLLVPDGSRRRTPGGVFFHLARQKLPRPLRFRIFAPPQPIAEQVVIPVQRPLKPPPPPPRGGRSRAVEVEYVRRGPRPATTTLPSQASDAPEGVHAPSAPASPSPVATGAVSPATSVTPPGAAVPSPPAKRRRIAPVRPRAEAPSADPSTETRTRTEEPSDADEAQPTSEPMTEPMTEPTPSSRRTAPLDRKAFVLALPHTMPVAQVLEAARQQGLQLSASYVYTLRKTHPEDPKSAVPHGADPAEPAAKARPVTRAPRNPGTRATPRPSTKAPPSERTRPSAKAPASTKASTSASPKARSTAKAQPATQARASARAPASIKAPPKASKTHSAPKPRPAAKARSAPKPQPAAKARSTAKASPAKRSRKSTDFLGDAIQSTVEQELSKLSPEERRRVLDLLLRGDRKKRK